MEVLSGLIAAFIVYHVAKVVLPDGPVTTQQNLIGAFAVFISVFCFMGWYIEPVGVGLDRRMDAPPNMLTRAIEFACAALVSYAIPFVIEWVRNRREKHNLK
jgi:hypothetical protein